MIRYISLLYVSGRCFTSRRATYAPRHWPTTARRRRRRDSPSYHARRAYKRRLRKAVALRVAHSAFGYTLIFAAFSLIFAFDAMIRSAYDEPQPHNTTCFRLRILDGFVLRYFAGHSLLSFEFLFTAPSGQTCLARRHAARRRRTPKCPSRPTYQSATMTRGLISVIALQAFEGHT